MFVLVFLLLHNDGFTVVKKLGTYDLIEDCYFKEYEFRPYLESGEELKCINAERLLEIYDY